MSAPSARPGTGWDRRLASADQLAGLYGHLERVLVAIDFQREDGPRAATTRLRRLFGRARLDETETAILRGILTHVERGLAQGARSDRP